MAEKQQCSSSAKRYSRSASQVYWTKTSKVSHVIRESRLHPHHNHSTNREYMTCTEVSYSKKQYQSEISNMRESSTSIIQRMSKKTPAHKRTKKQVLKAKGAEMCPDQSIHHL